MVQSFESLLELDAAEVRRRFSWANARGRPDWLWPDISPDDWRASCERIARVTNAVLRGGDKPPRLEGGDVPPLSLAAYTSGMGPLLGWWIKEGLVETGAEVTGLLDLHLRQNQLRHQRMRRALADVLDDLNRASIQVIVLKGMHTGERYFPDGTTRPASDVDLLVKECDAVRARAILVSKGFRESDGNNWQPAGIGTAPRSLLFVHADDPWSIDLHTSIELQPSSGARPIKLNAWLYAEPFEIEGRLALALGQPMLLLHLAAHASGGLQNLTLLRLVELQLLIRTDAASEKLDWSSFIALGRKTGALHLAWPALALSEALAPGLVPPAALAEMKGACPQAVQCVIEELTPATAQRLDRRSLREHFMWARGFPGLIAQLGADFRPSALRRTMPLYGRRLRHRIASPTSSG